MSICKICTHLTACQAWVRHGKALYEDFEYSVDNCTQFTNNYDIVEVIRCKDCRFWHKDTLSCDFVSSDTNWYKEDFCSYGERKDNG